MYTYVSIATYNSTQRPVLVIFEGYVVESYVYIICYIMCLLKKKANGERIVFKNYF